MRNCDRCGFKKWLKPDSDQKRWGWSDGYRVRVWRCGKCSHLQAEEAPFYQGEAKILYVDIETSLSSMMNWSLHVPQKYIKPIMLLKPYFVTTWAAGWVNETKIHSGAVTGAQAKRGNDKQMLQGLWNLFDEADIIIGHNIDKFDIRKINWRFIDNGYHPPRDYRTVDTLKVVRKRFDAPSNTLDWLALHWGFNGKKDMSIDDWISVFQDGDQPTIDKMRRYNIGDVREGKKIYEKIKEWVRPWPARPRGGFKSEMDGN